MTGCAERRYSGYDPYYGGGYYGRNAADDAYYRQWLAERRYNYVEYNRLSRERQQEYWEWRNRNAGRFGNNNDRRYQGRENQGYQGNGRYTGNDRDREDRYARGDRDRDNRYAGGNRDRDDHRNRNRDSARNHDRDRDRHQSPNRRQDRDRDRDRDRDHDKR
jgi:hypothetical protein